MGHFTRSELAFYYALADAFTICDNYFCSVLGPTDPNRLMAISASIDPAGKNGGPVITTATDRAAMTGALNWKTMPEALLEARVSWKVYNDPTGILGLGVLSYFKNYTNPFSLTGLELIAKGLTPAIRTISKQTSRTAPCRASPGSSRRWRSASTPPRRRNGASISSSRS